MKFSITLTLFIILFSTTIFSQNKSEIIDKAKQLLVEKKFKLAEDLLEKQYKKNYNDLEFVWLYAYSAHQNKHNKLSVKLYDKAISIAPENNDLKLEYAKMLYETGELSAAEKQINILKKNNTDNYEVLLLDASILFWNGKFNKSKESLNKLDQLYPNNNLASAMRASIDETKAAFIQLNVNYLSDNQPLEAIYEQLKTGQYRSNMLYPVLSLKNYNFNPSSQVIEASLSNMFQSANSGFSAKIEGGIYFNELINQSNIIGEVFLKKNIFKNSNLKIGVNRKPYLSTQESTTIDLVQNNAFAALEIGNVKSFFINLTYNFQTFDDNNNIQTYSAWGITKPVFDSPLKIQLGYGFNYSNSETILYAPSITSNSEIKGTYSPYYTPDRQVINSGLILMNYTGFDKFKITAKGNYGFFAQNYSPYFLLSYDTSTGNTTTVLQSFKNSFSPFDLSLTIQFNISKNLTISAEALYFDTYFYDSFNAGITLNYKLF